MAKIEESGDRQDHCQKTKNRRQTSPWPKDEKQKTDKTMAKR